MCWVGVEGKGLAIVFKRRSGRDEGDDVTTLGQYMWSTMSEEDEVVV